MISKEDYKNAEVSGISYKKPKAYLLQESGLGTSEFAGRTAYNSFSNSENIAVIALNNTVNTKFADVDKANISAILPVLNNIDESVLLDQLAHVYHHDSVLEHCNLTYLIKGTSRGVLQEQSRHRIQSITVQSTRYTMSPIINAFIAHLPLIVEEGEYNTVETFSVFCDKNIDYLVTNGEYNEIEHSTIFHKLYYQYNKLGKEEFIKTFTSKSMRENALTNQDTPMNIFNKLQSCKQKKNVGDLAKHLVTDNWKVDLVFTMNLRGLSNYLKLRDSGAAWFQAQWLAQAVIEVTPQKYLNLINKKYKE